MTTHEPINYLDSVLTEEEKRCEYSHQWRNFTISRSGRFKSKNKHRHIVDGKIFDRHPVQDATNTSTNNSIMQQDTRNKVSSKILLTPRLS